MIQSMTGYGRATASAEGWTLTVELKSLNSRGMEFHFRLPGHYMQQELQLKNLFAPVLQRGKVTVAVSLQNAQEEKLDAATTIDGEALKAYYRRLKTLHAELGLQEPIRLERLLNLPGVMSERLNTITETEQHLLLKAAQQALDALVASREQEGSILAQDLRQRGVKMGEYLEQIPAHEAGRIPAIRQKLQNALRELGEPTDQQLGRVEQEILFYLEKLDITEEKVRFRAHLDHYLRLLDDAESQGRKLLFLTQELWREANTLGNKANEIQIQTLVVQIKDELEKIKEQLNNVL